MSWRPYIAALSFLLAGLLASGGCSGGGPATMDGGADAGPDTGSLSPECTTADDCDDADPCTLDRCNFELTCIHEVIDGDDDGYAEGACAGTPWKGGDCNDENPTVYPGAPELCDELDNDCNDEVDDEVADVVCSRDADEDGFGWRTDVVAGCNCPPGYIPPRSDAKFDCRDDDERINPGHTEYESTGYCTGGTCQAEFAYYDWDCNLEEEMEYPTTSDGPCHFESVGGFAVCRGSGWVSTTPECGESAEYRNCDASTGCRETVIPSQTQRCR